MRDFWPPCFWVEAKRNETKRPLCCWLEVRLGVYRVVRVVDKRRVTSVYVPECKLSIVFQHLLFASAAPRCHALAFHSPYSSPSTPQILFVVFFVLHRMYAKTSVWYASRSILNRHGSEVCQKQTSRNLPPQLQPTPAFLFVNNRIL
ncbi:hypothetical protein BDZ45DRAFT_99609 [Acephala macrosclerotiorum]|nr:hypothetical protein BDZ45DRAFT_99609 [Acephala macrosclerotiorum]